MKPVEFFKNKKITAFKGKKITVPDVIRRIVMICALCVFTYSSYELTNVYLDYKDGDEDYEDLNSLFEVPDISGETETQVDADGNIIIANNNKGAEWVWDYDGMLAINPDSKGWISQGNQISYPILQGNDNDYYLGHTAYYSENKNGSIFIDYRIPEGLEARNCIIYGHDMLNNSMFGSLIQYSSKSYYEQNKTFDVYIAYKHYKYYVFAAYETDSVGDTYTYEFPTDEDFQNYIDTAWARRLYETDVQGVGLEDHIITLSTCTRHNDDKRFIVQMVRGEEVTDDQQQ